MKWLNNKYYLERFSIFIYAAIFSAISFSCFALAMDEKVSSAQDQDQESIVVTIYNENLALIKDLRKVSLDEGVNKLAWRDVAAQIRPETTLLRNLTTSGQFRLREQNFDFDLLTPTKLLEKHRRSPLFVPIQRQDRRPAKQPQSFQPTKASF